MCSICSERGDLGSIMHILEGIPEVVRVTLIQAVLQLSEVAMEVGHTVTAQSHHCLVLSRGIHQPIHHLC